MRKLYTNALNQASIIDSSAVALNNSLLTIVNGSAISNFLPRPMEIREANPRKLLRKLHEGLTIDLRDEEPVRHYRPCDQMREKDQEEQMGTSNNTRFRRFLP